MLDALICIGFAFSLMGGEVRALRRIARRGSQYRQTKVGTSRPLVRRRTNCSLGIVQALVCFAFSLRRNVLARVDRLESARGLAI